MDKQIEGMANVMYDEMMSVIDKSKVLLLAGNAIRMSNELATALYKAGYQKIPEGAMVLTRAQEDKIFNDYVEYIKKVRKETAEKFAERVKMAFYYEFDELIPSIMSDKIDEIAKEITEGENGEG